MASNKQIIDYWNENNPGVGWLGVCGAANCVCFCCGREGTTQKHHIIPVGTVTVSDEERGWMDAHERRQLRMKIADLDFPYNIHLLCRACHKQAPHTTEKDVYWAWFASVRAFVSQVVDAIYLGFKQANATDYDIEAIFKDGKHNEFIATAKKMEFLHTGNDILTVISSTVCKMIFDTRNDTLAPAVTGFRI